jgi:hypothetical protein
MFSLIFKSALAAGLTLSITACGSDTTDADLKAAEGEAAKSAALDGKIECALAGKAEFGRDCTVERYTNSEGQFLMIKHPDGGFRRFKVLTNGRGVEPADGVDPNFKVTPIDADYAEIRSGEDMYRIPARSK